MMFQTEQQAERKKFEMQLEKKLKDFAIENNEGKIDWKNERKSKYYIIYNYHYERLERYSDCYFKGNHIYFTSKEIVQKAIETFKNELER